MSINSGVEWCHDTANLWWGCVEVAPECDNCYAREWAARFDRAKWGAHEPRLIMPGVWKSLAKMQRLAQESGEMRRVFVGSMMDIAEKEQPLVNAKGEPLMMMTSAVRQEFFARISTGQYPDLLFMLLSKRPQNYSGIMPPSWRARPPRNVAFGATTGTQKAIDSNVKALLAIERPAMLFLSCEPLLTPLILPEEFLAPNFSEDDDRFTARWAIVGCESLGSKTGRFAEHYEDEAAKVIGQCESFGVPVFHKQMPINGRVSHDMSEWPAHLRVRQFPAVPAGVS